MNEVKNIHCYFEKQNFLMNWFKMKFPCVKQIFNL